MLLAKLSVLNFIRVQLESLVTLYSENNIMMLLKVL